MKMNESGLASSIVALSTATLLSSLLVSIGFYNRAALDMAKTNNNRYWKESVGKLIKMVVVNTKQCSCNLKSIPFTSGQTDITLTAFNSTYANCSQVNTILNPGSVVQGKEVKSVSIKGLSAVTANIYSAVIFFEFMAPGDPDRETITHISHPIDLQMSSDLSSISACGNDQPFGETLTTLTHSTAVTIAMPDPDILSLDLTTVPAAKYLHENSTCQNLASVGSNGSIGSIYEFYKDGELIATFRGCSSHASTNLGSQRESGKIFKIPQGADTLKYGFNFWTESVNAVNHRSGQLTMELMR